MQGIKLMAKSVLRQQIDFLRAHAAKLRSEGNERARDFDEAADMGEEVSARRRKTQTPNLAKANAVLLERRRGRPSKRAGIINAILMGKETQGEIARRFGVSKQYVSQVAKSML